MIKTFLEKKYEKKPALTQNLRALESSLGKTLQAEQAIVDAIHELMGHPDQSQAHQQAVVMLKKSLSDIIRSVSYLKTAKSEETYKEFEAVKKKRIFR